jgi:glycosyltransferase involved in cell wall biosynthesis
LTHTQRPTVGLHLIAKNEAENIRTLFKSFEGCFDQIVLVDTGSTDDTVKIAKELGAQVHEFKWIDDFSAARNFALSKLTTDYACWLDLDDELTDAASFIKWRDNIMASAEYWIAVYQYDPSCAFARERVWKRDCKLVWNYPIHEGVTPYAGGKQVIANYTTAWKVTHLRTAEDLKKDRSRNLNIMDKLAATGKLDARMTYYYGKELFEADKSLDAFPKLLDAAANPELELHDRILAIQYACLAAMRLNQLDRAIALAHQGAQLSPSRAEFQVVLGDCYLKQSKLKEAIPYYNAAASCLDPESVGGKMRGAIFSHSDSYGRYPNMQLAKCYFHLSQLDKADYHIAEALKHAPTDTECLQVKEELKKVRRLVYIPPKGTGKATDEIIISCPPGGLYEWDEQKLKERGMGGSEIAAICMAREMHNLTGKTIRVFNSRQSLLDCNGVIYQPANQLQEYLCEREPLLNIAWRHNIKITNAPTVLWSHDLYCAGIENTDNYDKLAVLSPFHKRFIQGMFDIPDDKIFVTRNGVANAEKFQSKEKKAYKFVYASSPDRGLEHVLGALDLVHADGYVIELHVFYGVENMVAMGKGAEAEKYLKMLQSRPYVINHGLTLNRDLPKHYENACIWFYPTDFQETFCINALEMALSGVYCITRNYGALPDTLAPFIKDGMAEIWDFEPSDSKAWAQKIYQAINERKWERRKFIDRSKYNWSSVARSWLKEFKIG